ncbi:hypothetical protein SBA4_7080009 [Candidatus Sulfopaludibacter sp. SbA4]|nr:hypothetical protein SBA4_7080009 [Candidatus Sulfopaludibacter sp. SbA4]
MNQKQLHQDLPVAAELWRQIERLEATEKEHGHQLATTARRLHQLKKQVAQLTKNPRHAPRR